MPVRIYDIAKKLGIESIQVLAKAKELGISAARVPSSSLDKISADLLESAIKSSQAESVGRGLRGFQIGNFKAFADTQSIPIRPLTLVFGANSSGKSSVIHGLLLARHALDTGEIDVSRTALGGDSLDLGGFRQYVHRRDAIRRVELVAELNTDILRSNAWRLLNRGRSAKVTLNFGMPLISDIGQPQPCAAPCLISYDVEVDGQSVLRLSRRPDETMQLDRVDEEAIQPLIDAVLLNNSTTQSVEAQADRARVMEVVRDLIPTLRLKCGKLLPEHLLGEEFASARPPQPAPVGRGNRAEELANIAKLFVPRAIADVIGSINGALQTQLERLTYLGPLRSCPPRHLALAENEDRNWVAGGGYAWDVVRRDSVICEQVNKWLSAPDRLQTPYRLIVEGFVAPRQVEDVVAEEFWTILQELETCTDYRIDSTESVDRPHIQFAAFDGDEKARKLVARLLESAALERIDELTFWR